MLRKLFFVSLAVISLASCKKDKSDPQPVSSLSTKIDGAKVDFNTNVSAARNGDDVLVTGLGGDASSPFPSLNIYLDDDAAITAKTYSGADGEAAVIYVPANGQSPFSSDTDFTVTVSSITTTEIKGTFSGKVGNGAAIKTVSEGTFSAKFK